MSLHLSNSMDMLMSMPSPDAGFFACGWAGYAG